jgi:Phenylalanyl-tRNA synthetase beta subunit
LTPRDLSPVTGSFESPIRWHRDLPAGKESACPLVVGRYFRGLKNGPSPRWLQDRLTAIGLRPISALVDITNYVTFDLGRPLHVFDAAKLAGDLTMRLAREGEMIQALDGRTYELDPSMTVIADAKTLHGIGGVMGGEESGCSETTTEMFLEVALFDPIRTAETAQARHRERRALPLRARARSDVGPMGGRGRRTLVLALCGGEASHVVAAGEMPSWRRSLSLRPERIAALGGVEVPVAEAVRILEALGFEVERGANLLKVQPPSWRADVEGEADLVEEVVRVWGYDRVEPVSLPRTSAVPAPATTPSQRRAVHAKRLLAERGLLEAVTFSFMRRDWAELSAGCGGAGFGQSHQRRSRPDAPVLAAQSPGGGGTQCGPRLWRCRAVRGRAAL